MNEYESWVYERIDYRESNWKLIYENFWCWWNIHYFLYFEYVPFTSLIWFLVGYNTSFVSISYLLKYNSGQIEHFKKLQNSESCDISSTTTPHTKHFSLQALISNPRTRHSGQERSQISTHGWLDSVSLSTSSESSERVKVIKTRSCRSLTVVGCPSEKRERLMTGETKRREEGWINA